MKPVKFEGYNIVFGEGQEEYQPLPAHRSSTGEVTTAWELTEEEIKYLVTHKVLYLRTLTFNRPIQPQLPSVLPFDLEP